MTTLVPKFTLEAAHPEIVFIADQSGSMSGSKNAALVSALKVFLKSLPLGVRFNICAFGNRFKFLFPKSQAYNETNLNTAMSFVDSFTASYGGTEILQPITEAFKLRLPDMPLEVMLLTDGEIWAEDQVFKFINEQIHEKGVDARVFGLGIGGDVSHTLVEGVARAGNGFAQFVTQNEDTGQKVIRMLKGALYAHTKDYSLEVNYDDRDSAETSDDDDFEIVEKVNDCLKIADLPAQPSPKKGVMGKVKSFFDTSADVDKPLKTESGSRYAHLPAIEPPKLMQAPNSIPPLFPFNRTTVYLLLGPESAQKKVSSVTLRATGPDGPLELNIPVHYADVANVPTIHQLAARKAVQDLEEGRGWIQAAKAANGVAVKTNYESRFDELVERECVRLGEKFQVASKWTSFVAVEEKNGEAMEVDEKEKEEIAEQPMPEYAESMNLARKGFGGASFGARRYVDPSAVSLHSSTPAQAGGGLFGSIQSGGLFGNAQPGAVYSSGLFGHPSNSRNNPFGATGNEPGPAAGLFGNATNVDEVKSGLSLFGNSQQQPSEGLFGSPGLGNSDAVKSSGLSGNTSTNTNNGGTSGKDPSEGNCANDRNPFGSGSLFGQGDSFGSPAPMKPSMFGSQVSQTSASRRLSMGSYGFGSLGSSVNTTSTSVQAEESTDKHCAPSPTSITLDPQTASPSALTQSDSAPRSQMVQLSASAPNVQYKSKSKSASAFAPMRKRMHMAPSAQPAALSTYDPTIEDAESEDEDMGLALDLGLAQKGEALGSVSFSSYPQQQQVQVQDAPLMSATYNPTGASFGPGVGVPPAPAGPSAPAPVSESSGGRTKETARKSTSGMAPRKQFVSKASMECAPSSGVYFDAEGSGESARHTSLTQAMHALINLQTFSGAWAWDQELFSILGIAEESVLKDELGGPNAEIRATALAVAWLEKKVPQEKGVWEMVVEKAKGWMKGQGVDVLEIVGKAGAYF
jgi:hypothetical protein